MALLFLGVLVPAGSAAEAHSWWNEGWTVRRKITIDPAAATISEPAGTAIVLVRLYDGNFQFGTARDDGSDLRFIAADDKTPLKYHLERYDGLLYEAYAWVKVPDIKPGAPITFWMYSGNAGEAPSAGAADAKTTYDADTLLVWHFSETGGAAPTDATGQGHNAEGNAVPVAASAIAGGVRLTGLNGLTIPAAPDLVWIGGAPATISLWVKPTTLAPNAVLLSRRENDKSFVLGFDNGTPYVEIDTQRAASPTPLEANIWKHITVTAEGSKTTLWVDGAAVATLPVGLPTLNAPYVIGKDKAVEGNNPAFTGEIDELEIAKTARPAGWIKLSAISQGGGDPAKRLVACGDEEAAAHGGEGELAKHLSLIADISKSLTFDGWVVIALCTILAGIGGIVAVAKLIYLSRIKKGTDAFLKHWEELAGNLHVLDNGDEDTIKSMGGKASPKVQKILNQSPLYHIYQIGFNEIQDRLASARENFAGLSGRSMQAIRATLDGGLVRETQRLNGSLVFLTIGIAGGPYLGLLGTVIGVMITFAVIAKSGQVEVNSIAPGIAGALLATVAGLAVAIPALFAYSYISSRIKDAVSEMQIFIDEFVTRIAEFYSEPPR
jgi:biopolymer transport protein ExbB